MDDPDVGIDLTKLLSDDSRGVMAPAVGGPEFEDEVGSTHERPGSDQTYDEPNSEGFAHLLFSGRSEEEVEDMAAKVNTWRIIPQRALPKLADFIIEIEARATGGAECCEHNCEGCDACNRRFFAWQDFRFLFQLLARNKEAEPQVPQTQKSGPKVDDIIRDRAQQVKQYGWKGVVEEYISDAALRLKSDLDKGPAVPVQRVLGDPASAQDADAFCRNMPPVTAK